MMTPQARWSLACRGVVAAGTVLLLATALTLVPASPAAAGPADDFTLTKTDNVDGEALIGENVTYTLTAQGTQSSAAGLYNTSFSDVIPAGVRFLSSDPAPVSIVPAVWNPAQPTVVVWTNVADLPANSGVSVTYTVDTDPDTVPGTVPVGSTVTNTATAAASLNAFQIPDYNANTGAFTGDFDGDATTSHNLAIIPFRVKKTGPGELLRGVHTAGFGGRGGTPGARYQVEIQNNPNYSTNSVGLTDTLAPQLEFLGCSNYYNPADDSSTDVPLRESTALADEEWAGSGPMSTGAGTCATPTSVNSVAAGGGSANTVVTWGIGNLAPGATSLIEYDAGIPMRANTMTWTTTGGAPTAASRNQGRNLDNNAGPSTNELDRTLGADPELLSDGAPLVPNTAAATGTFAPNGQSYTRTDVEETEAEDIVIGKSMTGSLLHGSIVNTTLNISVSEYRDFTNLVVRDLQPSALCYLGGFNNDLTGTDWNTNDCPGAGGTDGTIAGGAAPAHSVREIAGGGPYGTGRMELVWRYDSAGQGALANLDSDQGITITYASVVRTDYRGGLARLTNRPVLSGDNVTNEVEVSGPDFVVTGHTNDAGADDEPDGGVDGDTASAGLENSFPSIVKDVSAHSGPLADGAAATGATCGASYGSITWVDPLSTGFGSGDIICFRMRATYPAGMDFAGTTIQDLMPPGYTYVAGSEARISGGDTIPSTSFSVVSNPPAGGGVLQWTLNGDGVVSNAGNTFIWVFAAQLGDPKLYAAYDIQSNLMKMTHRNSAGAVFQYRDDAQSEWTEPQVKLAKGVQSVDSTDNTIDAGPHGPDWDGSTTGGSTSAVVQNLTVVTYRIDLWNDGNEAALDTEVWDRIPAGMTCAQISNISNGGSCSSNMIRWTALPAIARDTTKAAPSRTLTYDLTVPGTVDPGRSFTNTAGVRTYRAQTDTGFTDYFPASNIDTTVTAGQVNADRADDRAFIDTVAASTAKLQRSGISEGGNAQNAALGTGAEEATIGEIVQYRISVTIPKGTSVYGASLYDVLPAGLVYFEGNALFAGSVQNLQPVVASSDTDRNGVNLDSGSLSTPAVGANGTVRYTLPTPYQAAVGGTDDVVSVTFYAQVADVAGNQARPTQTSLSNRSSFDWDQSDGTDRTDLNSASRTTAVVEPNPVIVKDHTVPAGSNVIAGQAVTYRVTVTNPDPPTSTSLAHDLALVDTVPLGVTPLGTGGVPVTTNGDLVPSTGVTPAGSFNGVWSQTNRTINWTTANWATLQTLAPAGTIRFTYGAQVDDPIVASTSFTNTVDLTTANLDDTDPNLADGRTYNRSDIETLNAPLASIIKDVEPLPSDATDQATFTVGEPVDFDIEMSLPAGTIAQDTTLFDQLPSRFDFDSFGTPVVSAACREWDNGSATMGGALTAAAIERFNPTGGDARRVAWFVGDVIANGATCTITFPYTVHVNSTAVVGDTITNASQLRWNTTDAIASQSPASLPASYNSPSSGSWTSGTPVDSETITIVEPRLEIDKDVTAVTGPSVNPPCDNTAGNNRTGQNDVDTQSGLTNGCDTIPGGVLRYRLRVTNAGNSAAHDITVVDQLPADLTPRRTVGGALATTTGQTITGNTGSVGVWNQTNRTITWTLTGPVASSGNTTVDYDAVVASSAALTRGQDLVNDADIDSYYGLTAAERTSITTTNPGNDDIPVYGNGPSATRGTLLADAAVVEVHFPQLTIAKTHVAPSDPTDARFDQPFTWQLTVTNTDAIASAYDVDVTDVLPQGWTYVTGSALVTTPYGGPTAVNPICTADTGACNNAPSDNTETLAWANVVSGNAQPLGPGQTITVRLQAVPESEALASTSAIGISNTGPTNPHTNTGSVAAEDVSGATSCCSGQTYTDSDTHDVVIRRADLSVTKAILDPLPVAYGDLVTYRITLNNAGPSAATNVTLVDVLDPELVYDSTVRIDQGTFNSVSGTWNVGTVAVGSLVLEVAVTIDSADPITNTAAVETSDQWDPDSTPGSGPSSEDDTDSVTIDPDGTALGNRIWFDIDRDGVQDPGEPGIPGVLVAVSYLDASNRLQVRTSTTDSDGNWGIPFLPIDTPLTVTVDPSNSANPAGTGGAGGTLPDGLGQTWELVDAPILGNSQASNGRTTGLDHEVVNVQLTTVNQTYLDVDFGYVGVNSVGDAVWYDLDGDGTGSIEAGDQPFTAVDMTLTWAGWDGDLATTADNLTFTVPTDSSGEYLFGGLPDGTYRVDLDSADIPAAFRTPTYDLNGIATPHTSGTFTLGAGTPPENKRNVDFSYSGVGSIGDTVWFDLDRDGVFDTNEVPLGNVTVTITFAGPDGPVTIVRQTDSSGNYLVEHLPLGVAITVTVDPTSLPGGLTQTFDRDGTLNNATTVTLTSGTPNVLNADFGYAGDASIGDTIWWDLDGAGGPTPAAGDPLLAGVTVTLVWDNPSGPDLTLTTTTDSAGQYLFPGLPDGSYTITVDQADLAGMTPVYDPDGGTPWTSAVTITGGADDLVQDFSVTGVNSVGDAVWYDVDGDGAAAPEAADQPLENVDLTLTWAGVDGVIGTADDVTLETTTDASGNYLFDNLPDGNFRVTVDPTSLPAGMRAQTFDLNGVATANTSGAFPLGVGQAPPENKVNVDFAYTGEGSLGDTVWWDRDSDGVLDAGEATLAGVGITVTYEGPDGPVTITTTTGADGTYLVEHLPLGVPITVTVDSSTLPGGLAQTFDLDGTLDDETVVTLTSGTPDRVDADFGYAGVGSIGDTLWWDLDGSGEATPGVDDVPLAGVTVTLVWDNPSGPDVTMTTVTDANGQYLFLGLPSGDYTVSIDETTLPGGVEPVYDPDGGADWTSVVTLSPTVPDDLDQDFSLTGTGALGDTIWIDDDGDGVIDPGEELLEGVTVTITWTDPVSGSTTTFTVVTDDQGQWNLDNLPAGEYTVVVDPSTLPEGVVPTYDLDGDLDGETAVDLGPGEENLDVDFGYRLEINLTIRKTHDGDFRIGDEAVWNIRVRNEGSSPAAAPIRVRDELPEGIRFLGANDDWDCAGDGQELVCTLVDGGGSPRGLDGGERIDLDLRVAVDPEAAPGVVNTATVVAPNAPETTTDDNTDDDPVNVPLAILDIDKRLDGRLEVGKLATYELIVTNLGPSPSSGEIVVRDVLPNGLTYVANRVPSGVICTVTGQEVVCRTTVTLDVDQGFTIEIDVKVDGSSGSNLINEASVDGGNLVEGEPIDPEVIDEIVDEITNNPTGELATDLGIDPDSATDLAVVDVVSATIVPPGGGGTLPYTGIELARLLTTALIFLAMGFALRALSRRTARA